MEALIVAKPSIKLIGFATNVTLYDVQHNKTTIKLASDFLDRGSEVKNCINEREMFGISTDPEDYNPENDPFEFFIGIEVFSDEYIPEGMVFREIPENTYVVFTFKGQPKMQVLCTLTSIQPG